MAASPKPSVVLLGLPSHHKMVPEHLQAKVAETIAEVGEEFKALGVPFHFLAASPEDDLHELTQKLSQVCPVHFCTIKAALARRSSVRPPPHR